MIGRAFRIHRSPWNWGETLSNWGGAPVLKVKSRLDPAIESGAGARVRETAGRNIPDDSGCPCGWNARLPADGPRTQRLLACLFVRSRSRAAIRKRLADVRRGRASLAESLPIKRLDPDRRLGSDSLAGAADLISVYPARTAASPTLLRSSRGQGGGLLCHLGST